VRLRRIRASLLVVVVTLRGSGRSCWLSPLTLRRIGARLLAVVVTLRGIGALLSAVACDVAQDPGEVVGCRRGVALDPGEVVGCRR